MLVEDKNLIVTMPDGSVWSVPVLVIARDRAKYYASEFGGDIECSLKQDTLPCFEECEYEVEDWAANNMNWSEVKDVAKRIEDAPPTDYQEGWINGDKMVN